VLLHKNGRTSGHLLLEGESEGALYPPRKMGGQERSETAWASKDRTGVWSWPAGGNSTQKSVLSPEKCLIKVEGSPYPRPTEGLYGGKKNGRKTRFVRVGGGRGGGVEGVHQEKLCAREKTETTFDFRDCFHRNGQSPRH